VGLCIGSFLNVVIYRLPLGKSVVSPGSRCTKCGYELRWYDNVPVLSWAMLGGRCRQCQTSISPQYPIVELITGLLFVLVAWVTPVGPLLLSRLILVAILVVLFGIDLEHQILPNVITLPGIIVGLMFSFIAPPGWKDALLGVLLGAGVLYGIAAAYYAVRREEGLGMGDVKMLAMIGAFLGWRLTLVTLIFASFTGALAGAAMLVTGRGGMKAALPFGTFLAAGAFVAAVAGDQIFNWYVSLYR
jgi:leader peptidase (prepilin peptidase)/N-methyltransferase